MATPLPDHVLQEIEAFARRHKRPRRTFWADKVTGCLRRARHVIADALDGAARDSFLSPPP